MPRVLGECPEFCLRQQDQEAAVAAVAAAMAASLLLVVDCLLADQQLGNWQVPLLCLEGQLAMNLQSDMRNKHRLVWLRSTRGI